MNQKTTLIAEIGSNFDSDLELAKKYIVASRDSGADAVKFQTLRKEKLIAPKILIEGKLEDNPVYNNFTNLELPEEWHFVLKATADKIGINFFSTPFYLEAVDFLEKVGVSTYKVASGDITFFPLLKAVGNTGKPIILSTGASSIADVDKALNILTQAGADEITLLHCVSSYPPKYNEINLRAMITLKETFGLPVGISDHSPGYLVAIAAVAMGASVVEKHITFDRSLPGPDHPFAMTLEEFAEMANQIRLLELVLGNGEKVPTKDELARQHRLRRGVYNPRTYEPIDENKGIWLRPEHGRPF